MIRNPFLRRYINVMCNYLGEPYYLFPESIVRGQAVIYIAENIDGVHAWLMSRDIPHRIYCIDKIEDALNVVEAFNELDALSSRDPKLTQPYKRGGEPVMYAQYKT